MDDETIATIRSYIEQVEFARRNAGHICISEIFACGCKGPAGDCPCMRRDRLVSQFLHGDAPKEGE